MVISYATAAYFMDTKIRTGAFSLRHIARALKRGAREDHMRVRKGRSFQAGRVQTSLGYVNRPQNANTRVEMKEEREKSCAKWTVKIVYFIQ